MIRRNLLIAGCLIFIVVRIGNAQYPDPSLMNDKEYSRYCIEHLKEGALIVRLNFKTKAIMAFEEHGSKAEADRIRLEQQTENLKIVTAFKNYYSFCPVYFISFDSTMAAREGKRSGYFLDENLKVDPNITMDKSFFLFAEYGMLETTVEPDKTKQEQKDVHRGTMADALVIRNQEMELLRRPFPYYVHFGTWEVRVKKLNMRLEKFYTRS